MRHVAFLRNVNQGQRGHPTSAGILSAFSAAGAREVRCFQSNGTVVFTSDDPEPALKRATVELAARSGIHRQAFWMPLAEVVAIVQTHSRRPDAARRELTLHSGDRIDIADHENVRLAAHHRCEIVDAGPGWFVSVNEADGASNAGPVAERLTGAPATSRGLPTLVRLVDAFSPADQGIA